MSLESLQCLLQCPAWHPSQGHLFPARHIATHFEDNFHQWGQDNDEVHEVPFAFRIPPEKTTAVQHIITRSVYGHFMPHDLQNYGALGFQSSMAWNIACCPWFTTLGQVAVTKSSIFGQGFEGTAPQKRGLRSPYQQWKASNGIVNGTRHFLINKSCGFLHQKPRAYRNHMVVWNHTIWHYNIISDNMVSNHHVVSIGMILSHLMVIQYIIFLENRT